MKYSEGKTDWGCATILDAMKSALTDECKMFLLNYWEIFSLIWAIKINISILKCGKAFMRSILKNCAMQRSMKRSTYTNFVMCFFCSFFFFLFFWLHVYFSVAQFAYFVIYVFALVLHNMAYTASTWLKHSLNFIYSCAQNILCCWKSSKNLNKIGNAFKNISNKSTNANFRLVAMHFTLGWVFLCKIYLLQR